MRRREFIKLVGSAAAAINGLAPRGRFFGATG
jgi:hypothetical protein